jgi:hypothetical protein
VESLSGFSDLPNLAKVSFSVGRIERGALAFCMALLSVRISGLGKVIRPFVFASSRIRQVAFASHPSLAVIDEGAFANCLGLLSIAIPDSVTRIRGRAFSGCSWLGEHERLGKWKQHEHNLKNQ